MKELLKALGVTTEAEGVSIVTASQAFTAKIVALAGNCSPDEAIGKITAWSALSSDDKSRKEEEAARVDSALASLATDEIGNADELKGVYAKAGFLAFSDACTDARKVHAEAHEIIDGLATDGRLPPADKPKFVALFRDNGIAALKASASVLPAGKISNAPAPKQIANSGAPTGESGLTEAEIEVCQAMGTDLKVFAEKKAKLAASDAKNKITGGQR